METSEQHTASDLFTSYYPIATSFPGSFISLWGGEVRSSGEMQDPGNEVDLTSSGILNTTIRAIIIIDA